PPAANNAPAAASVAVRMLRRCIGYSLVVDGGAECSAGPRSVGVGRRGLRRLLGLADQRRAVVVAHPVEPKDAVIAAAQRQSGIIARLVAPRDADRVDLDDEGLVARPKRDGEAAAAAFGATGQLHALPFGLGHLGVAAAAVGGELALAIAELEAHPE